MTARSHRRQSGGRIGVSGLEAINGLAPENWNYPKLV